LNFIKSCVFHYELEFIHPFEDGNGRIGRFWQTLILSQYNAIIEFIPIESQIFANQLQYYKTLEACDKKGDSTDFIDLMLNLILKSVREFSFHCLPEVENFET
jgi:Fic family protein